MFVVWLVIAPSTQKLGPPANPRRFKRFDSGAQIDGEFRPEDSRRLLERTRTTHFEPGTQYSYSNGNFRLLSDMLEERLGDSFGSLLLRHVARPAGMESALFANETARLPGDAVVYEGDPDFGYVPAQNRIHWSGDAGLTACLDDMIAWERHIDITRDEPTSIYRRLSVPQTFRDGASAGYGFGLAHTERHNVQMTGHGGALRGWRAHRLYAASGRLSVVVLFNHQADAAAAALDVMGAALGWPVRTKTDRGFDKAWRGAYLDESTGLLLQLDSGTGSRPVDRLRSSFVTENEMLEPGSDGAAARQA